MKTEVKFEVKSEVKVVNGKKEKKAPQEGKKKKAPQEGKKAEPHEGEQKKERKVQQDSTKWTTRTVSMAPAPVVEYIAPTPALPLCCCKGQVKDEMKGGSFASKYQSTYHPPSAMKYLVLVLEVLSLLKHVRQPTVQCSRSVNEQQHDHTTVDFVAENRVLPVTQVIDMLKEMKVKTETTKSQEQVDNSLALLMQEVLQKQMAFASKSQLCKDTSEMKARDVEEAQMQILAPSTKIEQAKDGTG